MKAKNTKPAARKPAVKPIVAKRAATTGVFIDMIGSTGKPNKKREAKSGMMVTGTVRGAAGKASAKPKLLPIEPPTFKPTHRTAKQLRAAVAAVMAKA